MCKQVILYILFWKKSKYEDCEKLLLKKCDAYIA